MFIHSGTLKRAGILAAVVAVGTAAAITYNAFLSTEGGLPEVLSPLQPIIKDEDGGVKQKTDIAFSPDGSFSMKIYRLSLKQKIKRQRSTIPQTARPPQKIKQIYKSHKGAQLGRGHRKDDKSHCGKRKRHFRSIHKKLCHRQGRVGTF